MLWLRKSKKGFTLIELMVVVAIIGILALLGLRTYIGQQDKAKNAIVIANASTIHTLIQGDFLDKSYSSSPGTGVLISIGGDNDTCTKLANMSNPFGGSNIAVLADIGDGAANEGEVIVDWVSENTFDIQGIGADGKLTGTKMTALK